MSTMGTTTTSGQGAADAAKGAASDVASEATSAAADVRETAKTEVRSVVSEATDRAGQVMQTTRAELRSQVADKTSSIASSLDGVAQQLKSMASKADDPDSPVAQLAQTAAEQIHRQGRRLDEGGIEGLLDDARRLARNRPGVFALGSVAAGFVFGRLAKHADLKQAVTSAKEELTGSGDQSAPQGSGPQSFAGAPAPSTPAMTGMGSAPSGAVGQGGTVLVESDPSAFHVGGTDGGGQR